MDFNVFKAYMTFNRMSDRKPSLQDLQAFRLGHNTLRVGFLTFGYDYKLKRLMLL